MELINSVRQAWCFERHKSLRDAEDCGLTVVKRLLNENVVRKRGDEKRPLASVLSFIQKSLDNAPNLMMCERSGSVPPPCRQIPFFVHDRVCLLFEFRRPIPNKLKIPPSHYMLASQKSIEMITRTLQSPKGPGNEPGFTACS